MIDPRDVGAAAAAVLAEDEHEGETYVLTGTEPITYERVAEELSTVAGRPIPFIAVPDEAARQSLIGAGIPEFVAGQLVTLFGLLRQGAYERSTDAVSVLTGRAPRTLAGFVRDHAEPFRFQSGVPTTGDEQAAVSANR